MYSFLILENLSVYLFYIIQGAARQEIRETFSLFIIIYTDVYAMPLEYTAEK